MNQLAQQQNHNLDRVILVDEKDQQIGVMDKVAAHRHPAKLHRASSVLLRNSKGKWLIQQRSSHKIVGAHQWANACCGNLRPTEDYLECANRRLQEELGISNVELKKIDKLTYQVQCNDEFGEHEMDTVFIGQYDSEVEPNPLEVQDTRWISTQDLLAELEKNESDFAPWTKLVLNSLPDFSEE
jgi:isopentenyl-diphosphate Delta-isomerase